jgi:hypothetical protein
MKRIWFCFFIGVLFLNNSARATRVVLDDVPHYNWWYGCTPTAAGSLMAYWDSQPGFENLYKPGDAQIWCGDGTWGTRRMVASQRHIDGDDNPPDSIASFMGTDSSGGTQPVAIAPGLEAFAEWDDTSDYDMTDGYEAVAGYFGYLDSSFEDIRAEIDAGRPVLMGMARATAGHSVVAYGYDDDITFTVWDAKEFQQITAPGFAVMDTWTQGSGAHSAWYSSELIPYGSPDVQEYFDPYGIEWWPYVEFNAWFLGDHDWQVSDFCTFQPVPEPATILFLSFGSIFLRKRRRK